MRNLAGDVHVVRGQCDATSSNWPDEKILKMGKLKIGLTHGHQVIAILTRGGNGIGVFVNTYQDRFCAQGLTDFFETFQDTSDNIT